MNTVQQVINPETNEVSFVSQALPLFEGGALVHDGEVNKADDSKRITSFFEFWPGWAMYLPVVVQWVGLSLYHRSLTLPFLANPSLTLSGMVGVPKSELMAQATGLCKNAILPWVTFTVDEASSQVQADKCIEDAAQNAIHLPFACKPDIGCRGVGVKLVKNAKQLADIIETYPPGATLLCQKLATWEPEVGVFYVKDPATGQSKVESLTYKYLPIITGDGQSTLGELIGKDRRAGELTHLYYERHKAAWDSVPAKDETIKLVFSASHSKGAIFHDVRAHITPELTQSIEDIMQGLPDFYYGRLDVKFPDVESLKAGKNLEIVEINGASSESIHIWDKNTTFFEAMRALLWQYRTLFRIGAYHRAQGKSAPSLSTFLKHWRTERELTKYYPLTD